MSGNNIISRMLDELPPDWPEAMVNLIDALRDYIRADEEIGQDLLRDGSITSQQYFEGMKETERLRVILKELEAHGVDPSLRGLLK